MGITRLSGNLGTRLRWNEVPEEINQTDSWVEPFKEIDDKLGLYSKLDLFTEDRTSRFSLFYYNNFANPSRFDGENYAWKTEFWNLSLSQQVGGLEFLAQYMTGKTDMGPGVVKTDFHAWYGLLSYKHNSQRASVRFDQFEVVDKDDFVFPSGNEDKNDSEGQAITIAYLYDLSETRTLALEWVTVKSKRDGNEGFGDKDPDDDLYQIMYRFTI
ncbi:MAG: hypothetical protein HRU19_20260 [Pseudobacteriovorax sp.]|nr:hypothetical protein [Pseudobacteriovorax sp.]